MSKEEERELIIEFLVELRNIKTSHVKEEDKSAIFSALIEGYIDILLTNQELEELGWK